MNTRSFTPEKTGARGFTLVELLVVIAIIGILAGIVVPNVVEFIQKGNSAAAISDIKAAETGITGLLSDAQRSDFDNWFDDNTTSKNNLDAMLANLDAALGNAQPLSSANRPLVVDAVRALTIFYTDMMYQLLRQGKNAPIAADLKPDIRQKLGNSYVDLGQDPWGEPYQFYLGPMRGQPYQMFRSYRLEPGVDVDVDFEDDTSEVYRYDDETQAEENEEAPGAPKADWDIVAAAAGSDGSPGHPASDFAFFGMPAPRDLPVYIYSRGKNNLTDSNSFLQVDEGSAFVYYGGGDDVNNWDREQGWTAAPR